MQGYWQTENPCDAHHAMCAATTLPVLETRQPLLGHTGAARYLGLSEVQGPRAIPQNARHMRGGAQIGRYRHNGSGPEKRSGSGRGRGSHQPAFADTSYWRDSRRISRICDKNMGHSQSWEGLLATGVTVRRIGQRDLSGSEIGLPDDGRSNCLDGLHKPVRRFHDIADATGSPQPLTGGVRPPVPCLPHARLDTSPGALQQKGSIIHPQAGLPPPGIVGTLISQTFLRRCR